MFVLQIFTVTYSDDDDPLKFPAKKFYILGSIPVPPVGSSLPFLINEDDGKYHDSILNLYSTYTSNLISCRK